LVYKVPSLSWDLFTKRKNPA